MIRVIIVDDEVLVRMGIQSYLEMYQSEISVLGTFFSPLEALEFMKEHPVDVVLTDIEMPDMNGMEYIRKMKEYNYAARIIILSCHDDFEYARESLKLGVDGYLLKHEIEEDVLLGEIKKSYQKYQDSMKSPTLEKEPGMIAQGKGMADHYVVCAIQIQALYDEHFREIPLQVEENMIYHLMEEMVDKKGVGHVLHARNGDVFLLVGFAPEENEKERIGILYQRLSQNLRNYLNREIQMAASPVFSDLEMVRRSYKTAAKRLELSFYDIHPPFLYFDDTAEVLDRESVPAFSCKDLQEQGWLTRSGEVLQVFLQNCRRKRVEPALVKGEVDKQLHVWMNHVMEYYGITEEEVGISMVYRDIDGFRNENVLYLRVVQYMEQVCWKVSEILKTRGRFYQVRQYIEEHLTESISQSEAAEHFGMSSNYFCQVFKEETGTTFTHYVNEKKIARVQQYLKNSEESLETISEKTGFFNVNYMSRLFKKLTGMTITEYRGSLSAESWNRAEKT